MKNLFTIICMGLFFPITIAAQTRNDAGLQGNAGAISGFFEAYEPVNFPSGATSWWHLLDVRHSNTNNNFAMQFAGSFYDQSLFFRKTADNASSPWSKVLLETNGKVGIGTTSPTVTLQVQKTSVQPALMIGGGVAGSPRLQVYGLDADPQAWMGLGSDMSGNDYEHSIYFPTGPANDRGLLTIGDYDGNQYNTRMVVLQNGNVGIGTTTPGEKLSVNGNIRAKEIKVETANWPDYVFEKDYKIAPLSDLEKYIKINKHLPDMPSAKEVESNGLELGEMNKALLKKVEELTLHLIEKDKEINFLNVQFSGEFKKIIKRLNELEKKQK